MLSNGAIDVLFVLNKHEICTLEFLSKTTEISKNTIINLLNELEDFLGSIPDTNVHLVRKSREGIRLIDSLQEMNTVLFTLSSQYDIHNNDIYDGRCIQEILILINEKNYVSLQYLADKMFISKGTIINDLNVIDGLLSFYHITLDRVRNRGVKINGKEADVRNLFSDIVNGKVNKTSAQILNYDQMNSLYSLFNKEFVDRVYFLIMKLLNDDLELSNIQMSAILVHVMIAIQRIQNDETLRMPIENLEKIKETKYYSISDKFSKAIEQSIGLVFNEHETAYIAIHLMCSKQVLQNYDLSEDGHDGIDEVLKKVVDEVIQLISRETGNDSIQDRELIDGLILHLKPTIGRLSNHLSTKNPYLDEIKRNYLPSFDIAIKINQIINEKYGTGYDEDEIAYLALHVQAHIERFRTLETKRKKVAIVCATGIGTSQLLIARLRNYFEEKIEVTALSVADIQKEEVQCTYDLILTTIPLDLNNKVIYIDPFFNENQLKNISKLLYAKPMKKVSKKASKSVYDLSIIHINQKETTEDNAISFICKELQDKGHVVEGFQSSVINRENIASTAYRNFAIPHGDDTLVKKSCIYVYVSKKGIQWDDKFIHVVFLIAMNKEQSSDFKDIFEELHNVISDDDTLDRIIEAKSNEEIYNLMLGEI